MCSPNSRKDIPRKLSRLKSSCGFTLIEVLVAIVILASGLMLIAEGLGRSQQSLKISENLILASQIAETKLAEYEIEAEERHKIRSGTDEGLAIFPGREFRWFKQANPYRHASLQDETRLNQALSRVSWKEGSRRNEMILETLVINRETQA